eukprot:EG_transcript_4543
MGGVMNVEKRLKDKPVVVIVGGGYGGAALAKLLDNEVNVLLVERKTMFYHNVGALRASVEGDATRILIPYTNLLKHGHVIQGEVTTIDPANNRLMLNNHPSPVPYDYLVLATGTSYCFPMKVAAADAVEVAKLIQGFAADLRRAQSVLIVGGGPVGCELAGEIRHVYPEKPITLLHSRPDLIPGNTPPTFKADIRKRLEGLGVTVCTNDRLVIPDAARLTPALAAPHNPGDEEPAVGLRYLVGGGPYAGQSGKTFDADIVIFATGGQTNSNAYERVASIPQTPEKQIVVDEYLRVKGQPKIFALGDCADIEAKLAYLAIEQAKAVAVNVLAAVQGKDLKPYKKTSRTLRLVNLGPAEGCGVMGNITIGKTITLLIKGKDLFTSKMRSELGVKAPTTDVHQATEVDFARLASRLNISEVEARQLVHNSTPIKHGPDATHI